MCYQFHSKLVGLPGFARDFYCQLCLYFYFSLSPCISVFLSLPSITPKPNITLNKPACWPACQPAPLSLSPPPSLFPDKKFPVEAHFWLDKLFYYIESISWKNSVVCWTSFLWALNLWKTVWVVCFSDETLIREMNSLLIGFGSFYWKSTC